MIEVLNSLKKEEEVSHTCTINRMKLLKSINSNYRRALDKLESLDESWQSPSCKKSMFTKSKCSIEDNDTGGSSSMDFIVTSHPKEYSRDSIRTFNWVTNQFDDFEISDDSTADETSSEDEDDSDPTTSSPTKKKPSNHGSESTGGWAWISLCWGSNAVKVTDARSYQSSNDEDDDDDDASNDSSQPSLSRVDQVLALPAMADDDISDITSVASIDDSDSDSSEGS